MGVGDWVRVGVKVGVLDGPGVEEFFVRPGVGVDVAVEHACLSPQGSMARFKIC